jgi:ATP adenylyltransferase
VTACDFCAELAGDGEHEFARRFGSTADRIVWASDEFVVIPTLGPLSFGHMLVVPRAHSTSFARLANPARAMSVVSEVRRHIESGLGTTVAFEHGCSGEGSSGGCGITHAHTHVVPMDQPLGLPNLEGVGWAPVAERDGVSTFGPTDYLYFSDIDRSEYVAPIERIPSQLLRRWVADRLGMRGWDWRSNVHDNDVLAVIEWMRSTDPPRLGLAA